MEDRPIPAENADRRPDEPDLTDETEFDDEESPFGFAQRRLPWIVAGGLFLVYLVTLNRWVRLDSLGAVARATGWDWSPQFAAPLLVLVTAPFRWLPAAWQPLALNALTALLGAVSAGLLVRCVALLPYDRTAESRQRERSEHSLLSLPLAWVPPLFAGLALGLGLTFWEQATAFTGEMLDLLLLAFAVHSLLSYRLTRREIELWLAAFVFGLGMANNHGMIAWFPCFLLALLWIRGFGFFNFNFLVRMFLFGIAGLLLYLLLPLIELGANKTGMGFWPYLRTILAAERTALLSVPPYLILLLSFTSLIPVFLSAIRWPANLGDTSAAGAMASVFIMRLVHIVMLLAALSALVEAPLSPRMLAGIPMLSLYFMSALVVGYYSGYLLLVFRTPEGRHRRHTPPNARLLNGLVTGLTLLAAAAVPLYQVGANFTRIRQQDGSDLAQLGDRLVRSLPEEPAYLLGDANIEPLLADAALRRFRGDNPHVMVATGLLRLPVYNQQMSKRYGERWPVPGPDPAAGAVRSEGEVAQWLVQLADTHPVFYLQPSFGYLFETVGLRPEGLAYRVIGLGTDFTNETRLTKEVIRKNEEFWTGTETLLPKNRPSANEPDTRRFVRGVLSRALNYWGVRLQRNGELAAAARRFEQSLAADPGNLAAGVNLEFNRPLAAGTLPPLDLSQGLDLEDKRATWDRLIGRHGPFDNPRWCYRLGIVCAESSLFRQALHEFLRVSELYPENPAARLWSRNMEALTLLGAGDRAAALDRAQALARDFPDKETSLETLTQVYIYCNDPTNALATVKRQLALNPGNERALLNEGALSIRLGAYAEAIPPLSRLLEKHPEHQAARLNRAIAALQNADLKRAREDYEVLLKEAPDFYALHFGLGEVARQQDRKADAARHFQLYLDHAPKGTAEYAEVERKLTALK
ncbi:MAG: tetratricopeptide repeat protein [Verrucomicrobiales bacterium]|nr:tetratricopeptide repeat protein [Verrucomicrobiales bacterium]